MPRILVFNVPSQGHINPTLPLVRELVQRGAEVTYYLTPAYRQAIEATGATFCAYEAIPDDYFESHGLDGSNPPKTALTLIKTAQAILPDLLQITRDLQPDIILYDSMCPWGWMVGEVTGIPHVSSMSLFMFDTLLLIRSGASGALIPMMLRNFGKIPKFNRIAGELNKQYGIKNPGFAQFLNATGKITISYTSKMLQPAGDKMPSSIKFVGPAIEPRLDNSDFPFDQLSGQPLIYISLGTVINQNVAFYRQCIEAFGGKPYQVVLSIGKKTDIAALGAIPANFIVRNFVPQLEILQKASLFITHAGMNSVHEGLYYHVPLLLVPQQVEQRYVAMRIQMLNAGLMLASTTPSAADLLSNAQRILQDAKFKQGAAEVGKSLKEAGGVQRAAGEILQLV